MSSANTGTTNKHIRPKVRRHNNRGSCPTIPADNAAAAAPKTAPTTTDGSSTTAATTTSTTALLTKSILRKPKYGTKNSDVLPLEDRGLPQNQSAKPVEEQSPAAPPVVRATVMERPRTKRSKAKAAAPATRTAETTNVTSTSAAAKKAAVSIEGYTPRHDVPTGEKGTKKDSTTSKKPRTKEQEALILNSLAELMEKTGIQLPDEQTPVAEASVVEADLAFSVMAPEEFDEYKEEQRQAQYEVFLGKPSVFQKPNETDKENSVDDPDENENLLDTNDEDQDDDEEDDEGLLDDFFDDSDEEEAITREPRAFMKLWSALSQWVTPQAVAFVNILRSPSPDDEGGTLDVQSAVDRSDLGASRCAGLMVMIQMYIRTALEELGHDLEERRHTERLVGDLLRTFDYSRPSPKLDVAQSKAMTTILLQTVLYKPEDLDPAATGVLAKVPPSCQNLGMTMEEFRYLTVSAICNLATPAVSY